MHVDGSVSGMLTEACQAVQCDRKSLLACFAPVFFWKPPGNAAAAADAPDEEIRPA